MAARSKPALQLATENGRRRREYAVLVRRITVSYATITVRASSDEAATRQALRLAPQTKFPQGENEYAPTTLVEHLDD